MKSSKALILAIFSVLITACTTVSNNDLKSEENLEQLVEFAQANCFYAYFRSKSYDYESLRGISGGMVETSELSSEVFRKTALLVKEYTPKISTKQHIDPALNKCFYLRNDSSFKSKLRKLLK